MRSKDLLLSEIGCFLVKGESCFFKCCKIKYFVYIGVDIVFGKSIIMKEDFLFMSLFIELLK